MSTPPALIPMGPRQPYTVVLQLPPDVQIVALLVAYTAQAELEEHQQDQDAPGTFAGEVTLHSTLQLVMRLAPPSIVTVLDRLKESAESFKSQARRQMQ